MGIDSWAQDKTMIHKQSLQKQTDENYNCFLYLGLIHLILFVCHITYYLKAQTGVRCQDQVCHCIKAKTVFYMTIISMNIFNNRLIVIIIKFWLSFEWVSLLSFMIYYKLVWQCGFTPDCVSEILCFNLKRTLRLFMQCLSPPVDGSTHFYMC